MAGVNRKFFQFLYDSVHFTSNKYIHIFLQCKGMREGKGESRG